MLIADHIARLCAGAFAELCAIYVRASPGPPIAFATRDPGRYQNLSEAPLDDRYADLARAAGLDRVLNQPLVVDGSAMGSVVLAASTTSRLAEVTPELCESICSILSNAIAQALQLDHHHRVSERLQRAMLPTRLADVSGIAFDAAYRPASSEAEVGGDWYDAFDIGNGTIGISVGDVTGHGLEAAITMSEIRSAIRAAAATHSSPVALLDAVEMMVSSQGLGVASAIAGIYDSTTRVLRYACAGHPPPVLVTSSGEAYLLPGGGLLLGLGQPASSPERTLTIAPGATCFFYTDGLTEHHRDLLAGEERLLSALEAMASQGALTAEELHARIIGAGPNLDDCATLVLRQDHTGATAVERYTFSSLPNSARLARDSIRSFAQRCGVDSMRLFDVVIAGGEAVANAIEHGSASPGTTFSIELAAGPAQMLVRVESAGHWRTAPSQTDRGRGVAIIRTCAKNVEIRSSAERTQLTMTFDVR